MTDEKLSQLRTDGKKYKPWCDKYFPLDYGSLFGMAGLMDLVPFFNVNVVQTDQYGNPEYEGELVERYEQIITVDPVTYEETIDYITNVEFIPKFPLTFVTQNYPVAVQDGYAYVNTRY